MKCIFNEYVKQNYLFLMIKGFICITSNVLFGNTFLFYLYTYIGVSVLVYVFYNALMLDSHLFGIVLITIENMNLCICNNIVY